jgi:hemerythrin-like metal-binding protein
MERLFFDYPVMDRDHEILFGILGQFEAAVSGRNNQRLSGLIISLAAYVEAHFENEEHLMKLHGYPQPELSKHTLAHEEMRSNVSVLGTMVRSGYNGSAKDAVALLRGWIDQHLDTEDRKLVTFLKCAAAEPCLPAPTAP